MSCSSLKRITPEERLLPAMPATADGFPPGWQLRRIPGRNKSSNVSNMFYSPTMELKFRVKKEAHRFVEIMDEVKCNEAKALRLLLEEKGKKKSSKKSSKDYDESDSDYVDDGDEEGSGGKMHHRREQLDDEDATLSSLKQSLEDDDTSDDDDVRDNSGGEKATIGDVLHGRVAEEDGTIANANNIGGSAPEVQENTRVGDSTISSSAPDTCIKNGNGRHIKQEKTVKIKKEKGQAEAQPTARTSKPSSASTDQESHDDDAVQIIDTNHSRNTNEEIVDLTDDNLEKEIYQIVKEKGRVNIRDVADLYQQRYHKRLTFGGKFKIMLAKVSGVVCEGMGQHTILRIASEGERLSPQGEVRADVTTSGAGDNPPSEEVISSTHRSTPGSTAIEDEGGMNEEIQQQHYAYPNSQQSSNTDITDKGLHHQMIQQSQLFRASAVDRGIPPSNTERGIQKQTGIKQQEAREESSDIDISLHGQEDMQVDGFGRKPRCKSRSDLDSEDPKKDGRMPRHESRSNLELKERAHESGDTQQDGRMARHQSRSNLELKEGARDGGDATQDNRKPRHDSRSNLELKEGACDSGDNEEVILPVEMKAQLEILLSRESNEGNSVGEGDILSRVKGFVAACQGAPTDEVLGANFPDELCTETANGRKRYFLKSDKEPAKGLHNHPSNCSGSNQRRLSRPDAGGEASAVVSVGSKDSKDKETNENMARKEGMIDLSETMKATILSYISVAGKDGVRVKTLVRDIEGFEESCHGVSPRKVIEANLECELVMKEIKGKRKYFLKRDLAVGTDSQAKLEEVTSASLATSDVKEVKSVKKQPKKEAQVERKKHSYKRKKDTSPKQTIGSVVSRIVSCAGNSHIRFDSDSEAAPSESTLMVKKKGKDAKPPSEKSEIITEKKKLQVKLEPAKSPETVGSNAPNRLTEEKGRKASEGTSSSSSEQMTSNESTTNSPISDLAKLIKQHGRIVLNNINPEYERTYGRTLAIRGKLLSFLKRMPGVRVEITGSKAIAIWNNELPVTREHEDSTEEDCQNSTAEKRKLQVSVESEKSSKKKKQKTSDDKARSHPTPKKAPESKGEKSEPPRTVKEKSSAKKSAEKSSPKKSTEKRDKKSPKKKKADDDEEDEEVEDEAKPPTKKARKSTGKSEKKKDENTPKRPVNGYVRFSNDIREKIKADNLDLGPKGVMKLIGKAHKGLPESERSEYNEQAKAAFKEENPDLPKKGGDDDKAAIESSEKKELKCNTPFHSALSKVEASQEGDTLLESKLVKIIKQHGQIDLSAIKRQYKQTYGEDISFTGNLSAFLGSIPGVRLDRDAWKGCQAIWDAKLLTNAKQVTKVKLEQCGTMVKSECGAVEQSKYVEKKEKKVMDSRREEPPKEKSRAMKEQRNYHSKPTSNAHTRFDSTTDDGPPNGMRLSDVFNQHKSPQVQTKKASKSCPSRSNHNNKAEATMAKEQLLEPRSKKSTGEREQSATSHSSQSPQKSRTKPSVPSNTSTHGIDTSGLIRLYSEQASKVTKFPSGSKVVCSDHQQGSGSSAQMRIGEVVSVYADFSSQGKKIIHEIRYKDGKVNVDGNTLGFAPQSDVCYNNGGGSNDHATVILPRKKKNGKGYLYTIQLHHTDGEGVTIKSDVKYDHLSPAQPKKRPHNEQNTQLTNVCKRLKPDGRASTGGKSPRNKKMSGKIGKKNKTPAKGKRSKRS